MSFLNVVNQYQSFDIEKYCANVTSGKIRSILTSDNLSELDYLALLSEAATPFVEQMAERALFLTRLHFGNIIFIFTPLYISNYCENVCAYCSFARQHDIGRRHLSFDEIRNEAERISKTGIRHILVLTGESPSMASIEYLETSIKILSRYFSNVAIEIYPLSERDYGSLIKAGAEGLTIYQETYNKDQYCKLHKGGPKGDYQFRIEAPDRGCRQGMRAVTIGALFGLYEWRSEAFFTGLHAHFLQKTYPSVEVAVSFPRLRPLAGEFETEWLVDDRRFVQMMTAFRIFMPSAGITVSTRESQDFRNSILPLGVTKMSAGVSTAVGGHTGNPSTSQFEIADTRSLEDMKADLKRYGFQAVLHDWNTHYLSNT
jgi:2-iminoacetate synthase